jgi:tRNA (mo5U34)-methyltransferase
MAHAPGEIADEDVRARIAAFPHWYHRIEVRPGIVTPGINDSPLVLRHLSLPADARGLRVLDLGVRDGFFSFELERRGADVLAIDYMPAEATGFNVAAQLLGSRVPYVQENLYHLRPEKIGTFDLVLFLGLLYHLPDPLGALRIVRSLSRSRMLLETLVIDESVPLPNGSRAPLSTLAPGLARVPIMCFFPGDSMANDPSNYWGPNIECVHAMLAETEFAAGRIVRLGERAIFDCQTIADPKKAAVLAQSSGVVSL